MDSEALKQLYKIAKLQGITREDGCKARDLALKVWVDTWVVEVETSQPVIKKALSLEDEDFISYYMAYQMGDKLMDDCIFVNKEHNRISTRVFALKRGLP